MMMSGVSATDQLPGRAALARGAWAVNNRFTDSRVNTMIVKTPSTVPNGMKTHSTPPMTRQNK